MNENTYKSFGIFGWFLPIGSAISGQITVTTAGTAVQGPDVALNNGVYIKALPGNTKVGYAGNDGADDVTSANGSL